MKIKKCLNLLLAAEAVVLCVGNAHADMAFDGVNVQLGAGLSYTNVNASGTQDNSWVNDNMGLNGTSGSTRFNGLASIGYSKSIDSFNIAANVFYIIGNQSAGSKYASGAYSESISDGAQYSVGENLSSSYKLKNTWGISFEPGYYFKEKTLGYLKLAYVNSTLQSSLYCNASDSFCSNYTASPKSSLNGFGYGLGAKQMLTENIYAAVDLMGITYSSVNSSYNWFPDKSLQNNASFKTNQFIGFASIGYKF